MKSPLLLTASCLLGLLLLTSCLDPNYYGGGSFYGSYSYTSLPYGYRTVYVSGAPYYYYGSRWYRHHGGRYISCARPHGYHGSIGRTRYRHGSNWHRNSGSHYTPRAHTPSYKSYRKPDYHRKSSSNYSSHSGSHPSHGNYRSASTSSRTAAPSRSSMQSNKSRSHSNSSGLRANLGRERSHNR